MPKREIIEGRPVLLVIDIQEDTFVHEGEDDGIPVVEDYAERVSRTRALIDVAHDVNIPVVFIKEVHRPDHVDFGRELDGNEGVHCIETEPTTEYAKSMDPRPTDYFISKRRYSCFFGTDLEILLKGLGAETLVLTGGLTDVCVHYTFVDGHQHNYFCRVVEDCVAGSSERAHEGALEAMEYLQAGARRQRTEMINAFRRFADNRESSTAVSAVGV